MTNDSSVWQTAGRPRHSHSASRTPQNRSGTASPSQQQQQSQPPQPPRQEGGRAQQVNNVWAQRSSSTGGSNGQPRREQGSEGLPEEQHTPANSFNASEVKAVLGRETASAAYKPVDASGGNRGSGGAWGSKGMLMTTVDPTLATS